MTHSPAPWRLDHERVLDTNNDPVALITDTDGEVIDWPWMYDEQFCAPPAEVRHAEANARLIAAAPDLLEALKECVSELEGVGWGGAGYTDLAHAAIAAATGVPCNPELLSPAATADKATGQKETA
jgi:hypothetical protein